MIKLKFGEHKGKTVNEVPTEYLQMIWNSFKSRFENDQLLKQKRIQELMVYLRDAKEIYNGRVLKTSNGFSYKNAVKTFVKFLNSIDADFKIHTAKTGTTYIDFATDDLCLEVRFSNHTERGMDMDEVHFINKNIAQSMEKGLTPTYKFQVINQSTFNILTSILINN